MSPDLTELINSAEKATAVAPEAQPTAAGAAEAPNGEAEAEEDDEDEVDEGAAAGTGKRTKPGSGSETHMNADIWWVVDRCRQEKELVPVSAPPPGSCLV